MTAVDAPHVAHPEQFSFAELAQRIAAAAVAFRRAGVQNGDVVALFAENSPRWLVADQGVMRAGAADAVRGAAAPVEELRYILDDCRATALVVQNAALWERLALTPQRVRLRFVLQLEEPAEVVGWEAFLQSAAGQPSLTPTHGRDQVATVLYTSGTTGQPKGSADPRQPAASDALPGLCGLPGPGLPVLSVLPIWHAYERSASYYFLSCACTRPTHDQTAQKGSAAGAAHRDGHRAAPVGGRAGRF